MEPVKISQTVETAKYFCVNWALTSICNYRCRYCHPDLHDRTIKAPPLEDIMKFINSIFLYCNSSKLKPYFEFGGSEVTYISYFGKILKLIYEKNGLATIISNGSSPIRWWKENLPMLHCVSLSFHYEEVKSIEHFIDVAKLIAASPVTKLHVNVMMLPEEFNNCLEIAIQLREEVACSIALQPLFHGFGGGGITGRYHYTKLQDKIMTDFRGNEVIKNLPTPRGELNVFMSDGKVIKKSSFELLVNEQTNFSGWKCNAGIENIIVTFEGDIYRAWCMQDPPIGNVYDGKFSLPDTAVLCRTKICQCGPDICSGKLKV